jgi:hypothetical protein
MENEELDLDFEVFISDHESTTKKPEIDDYVYKIIVGIMIDQLYYPPENGFCGYASIFYGLCLDDEELANRFAFAVRYDLGEFFVANKDHINVSNYQITLQSLTTKPEPDLYREWWFSIPDTAVIACYFYEKSMIVISDDEIMGYCIKYENKEPSCILKRISEKEHFNMYMISYLPADYMNNLIEINVVK